ncbi:hypothetical protein CC2G_012111 [Coprinopsis cinerea AmutBmut pab1-1]|nr:hypothetical protein CC2G_012111 [Coprinopsis cinerea AmutBmut pab1-1]
MRTHALYQSQRLLYGLSALAVVAIVNMTACFLIILPHLTFVPAARKIGLVGCLSGCTHPICQPLLITFWIPFLLFETSVFLLTAWKSYETYKIARNTRSLKLVTILFRDGFIYYIVIICVSLINFMIWIFDPFASYLAVGLMKSLQATICSRLLLNIRGMLEPRGVICPDTGRTDGFTLSTISQSSIRQSNYQLPPPRRISWPSFSGDPFCLDEHEAGSSGDRKCSEEGVRTDRG